MPLIPGSKLGAYEVISAIGAGGMGEVYRARDTRLGRDVAVKVLPDSFAREGVRLNRFEQEARAVAALNHPNILAIHDIGEQNGAPFLVSELLEGNSLRVELEQGQQYCIHAVDLSGKERTAHCGAAPTVIQDFSGNGRALVMAEQARVSMAVIEHGASEEKDVTWLDFAYNPRLSADGNEILFTDQTGQSGSQYNVYVRKRDGSPAVRIGENGFGADITADGRFALVVKADDPQMRVQIVPVGPGEKSVLHWEGVQPIWAQWFHDGEHILLVASSPPGRPVALYVTDRKGAQPKLITEGTFGRAGPSPDGSWIVYLRGGKTLLRPITGGEPKPLPDIPVAQTPIAWGTDAEHVFLQENPQNEIRIGRMDLHTGKIEPWQVIRPKDQIGLRANNNPIAITPDGKWMAYAYGNELDQLYVSDGLK
jgi:hypothetical protein